MQGQDWIGRTRVATDSLTERLVAEYRATFAENLAPDQPLPALHWITCPEIYPPADLGRDAHPRLGLFLPDLGLPRRMWAGGEITYHGELTGGDTITRRSVISDVTLKDGRSGRLGFVALDHAYDAGGALVVEERHNIVYRAEADPTAPAPTLPEAAPWEGARRIEILPNATLLLRYSAMTFNGHRIHYDKAYAMEVEGYGGLVVHGPIQATWMQILAVQMLGRLPAHFAYRGLSPLICDRAAVVEAIEAEGGLKLRVRDLAANVTTMEASAR